MELLYVAGSHSLAPDVFEVAEAGEGKDVAGKLEAARTLDPEASGEEGAGGCGRACMRAARGARLWGRSAKVQPRGWRLGAPCALPGRPSLACLAAPCALAPTGCSNPSAPPPRPLPPPADGMNGVIVAAQGEACPSVMAAPYPGLGDDITSNSVVCCMYKLPPHHRHSVHLLPGAREEVSSQGRRPAGQGSRRLTACAGGCSLGLPCTPPLCWAVDAPCRLLRWAERLRGWRWRCRSPW